MQGRNSPIAKLLQLVPGVITGIFLVGVVLAVVGPFRSHLSWFVYLQDDCFYYLKVADNLAAGRGSTFNGIVLTNGYHPLWLALLTAYRWIFPLHSYFPFIAGCIAVATTSVYFLSRDLLRKTLISPIAVNGFAATVAAFSMQLFFTGMEIILTIPLVMVFLCLCQRIHASSLSFRNGLFLGLTVSAMVLSRLDSILLIIFLGLVALMHSEIRHALRKKWVAGVLIGLVPLLLYFISNQIIFHVWMPVSGMAKQMKVGLFPAAAAWHSLYVGPIKHFISFIPILIALVLLPRVYRATDTKRRILYPVVLLWPFVYVLILSCLSDWMLWGWYFYAFRIALCVSFLVICEVSSVRSVLSKAPAALLLSGFAIFKIFTQAWTPGDMPMMVETAEHIRTFSQSHPGVYAMGDRAGIVGYLMTQPLVQTEGLMMDRHYIEKIRSQQTLADALSTYGTRFYIATIYTPLGGCFHSFEPSQAGPASPHLHQDFCGKPVDVYEQDGVRTAIYDLQDSIR